MGYWSDVDIDMQQRETLDIPVFPQSTWGISWAMGTWNTWAYLFASPQIMSVEATA